jgi:uncharacterized protein (TIGR01440 family)
MYEEYQQQARAALAELLDEAGLEEGDLVVVGCSSSEILGEKIGSGSSPEMGQAVSEAILEELAVRGLCLAAQCCEHLNRALVMEKKDARRFGYEVVCVRPRPKAGGSFASAVYDLMRDPVAVEHIRAAAGLDIGATLIGMHLREVAVPVRLQNDRVGCAPVFAARTRPKLIGGSRADYP